MTSGLPVLLGALAKLGVRHPDRDALTAEGRTVSYGELSQRVDEQARRLLARGVRPGDLVAVVGHKDIDAVAAILSVLRCAAGYIPIDPRLPAARVAEILTDAGCALVIADPAADQALLADLPSGCAVLDQIELEPDHFPDALPALPERIDPEQIAYCMFTSGSTGKPKGVQISHRALDAFLAAVHPLLEVAGGDRCMNTSALNFDVSVVDIFYPMSQGASVVLTPLVPMPPLLASTIERERISYFAAVGSTLDLLVRYTDGLAGRNVGSLRRIMTGAEVLNPRTINALLAAAPGCRVVNGFGPTEATCLAIAHVIAELEPDRNEPYPIGTPLAGTTVRFLDEDGHGSADGPGEILLAGPQVMSGYLNSPAETAARTAVLDGVSFYRTGDFGFRDPAGQIQFSGRGDHQVKVRGYRVNLDEIVHALERSPGVRRAFVAKVLDRRGQESIAAAVHPATLPEDRQLWFGELTARLSSLLPHYMVPSSFLLLDELPTLSSGKLDTAELTRRLAATEEHAPA